MTQAARIAIGAVLLALVAIGTWNRLSPPSSTSPAPAVPPPVAASASEPATVASAMTYPIESAEGPVTVPSSNFESALTDLVGHKAVLSMFQVDGFARRLVATIDNLARQHAPSHLWPVNPADGRFTVESRGGAEVIGADNGLRYTPYVLLIETVDLRQAVVFYKRFYPQFQLAYAELGYPDRYFNDRLVEVIDQLLVTPEVTEPAQVHLPTINGPIQPPRPWVLYEFDDPALEALSAGQKILLRMGAVNARRMKAKLAEFRGLVVGGTTPR